MAETAATGSGATILVVEDERSIRQMVAMILSEAGYRVLQAADGSAGLSLAQEKKPDLIVSDVRMPGLDGFALCEQLRANPELAQTPFIFLTAYGQRSNVRRGMGLGADDYLTKPFEADELLDAVEVRLARAAEAQAAIDRAGADLRESIVRSLTHEFRTPLTLVAGYTELLQSDGLGLSQEEFDLVLEGLHSGSARLKSMVEDFLLLTQLEVGVIARQLAHAELLPMPPEPVVQKALAQAQGPAEARNVDLSADCETAQAGVAICAEHLAEIVGRLVDNAIKFSQESGGRVVVTTRFRDDEWHLAVADDGIGMPPEALSWIFDAFRQVDRAHLEQQGSGVGLTIVRGLAEVYGGRVTVESTPGRGSTFTVTLPAVELPAQ